MDWWNVCCIWEPVWEPPSVILVCIPLGLCAGTEGLTVLALGHTWHVCKSSMASPLGDSTHFIFSWCLCRVSSFLVSSGASISCSRATWCGVGVG